MSSQLCKCHIQCLLSSPPTYLSYRRCLSYPHSLKKEVKGWRCRLSAVYESLLFTSVGDCDRVKMSVFFQTGCVGCVRTNLTTLGKGARSICVPHISYHAAVDEAVAGPGVSAAHILTPPSGSSPPL